MEDKSSPGINPSVSSLYCIYSEEEEHNIYETIGKGIPSAPVYDEVFSEKKCSSKSEPPPYYTIESSNRPTFGKCLRVTTKTKKTKTTFFFIPWCCKRPLAYKIFLALAVPAVVVLYLDLKKGSNSNANVPACDGCTSSTSGPSPNPTPPNEACKDLDYRRKSWYTQGPDPKYTCASISLVRDVKVQYLQVEGQFCDKKPGCDELVRAYKKLADKSANYTFYIDGDANVYGGRDWNCPYNTGELWIAVMVNNCDPPCFNCTCLLRHFINEIQTYGEQCGYIANDIYIDYVGEYVISK